MLFNSYIFILGFLPICLGGYFILNHHKHYKLALVFVFMMSLWFYGYFNPSYLLIILFSIVFNYAVSIYILNTSGTRRKQFLGIAIIVNLGILFYYKYFNFFIDNLNHLVKEDLVFTTILLPLGISFFTFQQISYIADAYRGNAPRYDFWEYAAFVAYFPQLVAGPIVSHDELIPQFREEDKRKFSWDNFAKGLYIFSIGLAKKVIIADTFGNAVNWGFANIAELDFTNAAIVMLGYTLQIYFDFSGYCDMAIGLAKVMNLDLPLNFNSPYKACSIEEFWDRWHMTLTRFFTKYVYIPLGGNRKGKRRTHLNIMIVYLLSGIWHGANWTFILWGVLHGIATVFNKMTKPWLEKIPRATNLACTFIFVNLAWVLFRSDSIGQAVEVYGKLIAGEIGSINKNVTECFILPEFKLVLNRILPFEFLTTNPAIICIAFYAIALIMVFFAKNAFEKMERFKPKVTIMLTTMILLAWSICSFAGVSTFLYFNF